MATTLLADVIGDPDVFGAWVLEATMLLSGIDSSPVVQDDPELQQWISNEGNLFWTGPRYDSLTRTDEEIIVTQADPSEFGGAALRAPLGIATHIETAVRWYAANWWSSSKLAKYLNLKQADPKAWIINDIAGYWAFRRQVRFLSTWIGVFADNALAPAGADTHLQNDLTHDVSGGGFVAGQTNITAENFIDAVGLMGDAEDSLGYIITHSKVRQTMDKNDLLDVAKDSAPGQVRTYRGKPILINDNMTKGAGHIYHTYVFGAGSTLRANGTPDRPIEEAYYAHGGGGAGQDVLFSRQGGCYHPHGYRFMATPAAAGGPTNAELQAAASWSRSAPERKQIKAVRLITREA